MINSTKFIMVGMWYEDGFVVGVVLKILIKWLLYLGFG